MINKYSKYKIIGYREKLSSLEDGTTTSPIYVRIKPTNKCNHDCWWCIYSDSYRKKKYEEKRKMIKLETKMHKNMAESDSIPRNKMIEILSSLKTIGTKAITYSGGGEPLMYKHILEIMEKTLEYNINLSIITNGELLKGDKAKILSSAKWVRISMDYSNDTEMISSRGVKKGSFDRVMSNIENFSSIKNRDCDLTINYVVHKGNYNSLVKVAKDLKKIGVNNIRFSPVYSDDFSDYHENISHVINTQLLEIMSITDNHFNVNSTYDNSSLSHSNTRHYNRCFMQEIVPVIGADQKSIDATIKHTIN